MPISDGLGFEEVNQNVTFTEIISGTMLYAYSGLTTPIVNATTLYPVTSSGTTVLGATISGTNAYISTKTTSTTFSGTTVVANLSGTNVWGTNISGTNILNSQGTIQSIRAATAYGGFLQAGSGALGGGSAWVSFPIRFATAPIAVVTGYCGKDAPTHISQYVYAPLGSVSNGSFYACGSEGNIFTWVAVGT